jgi:hypothetical protein
VSNHKGVWLPATGAMVNKTTVEITPVTAVPGEWVSGVRYQVIDVPQCALYNAAGLPALPFELPLPWKGM